jgi:hypothetical protein
MILSFLIFGLLSGVIIITDAPLTNATVSLPFVFLFISLVTLLVTGKISERPHMADRYLLEWTASCIFGIVLGALAFTLA